MGRGETWCELAACAWDSARKLRSFVRRMDGPPFRGAAVAVPLLCAVPARLAGRGQPAQRCRLESLKKSSDLPKTAWMLRSALSKQEKSVDNLPLDCPLVGFWGGVVGVMDGVRELFVRFAMRRDWLRRCRCFAQCQPGLRAGAFPSARRSGLGPIKKSSNLLKPAWMLRSALSNQEKSVDNFLFFTLPASF